MYRFLLDIYIIANAVFDRTQKQNGERISLCKQ